MPVFGCRIRKDSTTKAYVLWIFLATHLMGVSLCPAINAAEAKHVVCLQEARVAELAFVIVGGILVTGDSMGIPRLRVGKEVATKTSIRRIVLATHGVNITKDFTIRS
jgi:hypothetical protein